MTVCAAFARAALFSPPENAGMDEEHGCIEPLHAGQCVVPEVASVYLRWRRHLRLPPAESQIDTADSSVRCDANLERKGASLPRLVTPVSSEA